MSGRLSRLVAAWLDLPEGQGARALRMLALIFLLSAALSLMKAAQSGIFLAAYPRTAIPWAFASSSLLLATLSAVAVAFTERLGTARLGGIALSWSALGLLGLRALLLLEEPAIPFVTYVVIEAASGVLVIQVWAVASAATDARTARRLLPVAGIGAGLAWTISGLAVHPMVEVIGAEGLLVASPALLALSWLVARAMAAHDLDVRDRQGRRAARTPLSEAFRFVARVPLLRMMAVLSILALVVEEVMDFHVMSTAREALGDADAISAFFGRYYAITSAIGVLLLAGPAARVLGALGATRSLVATPLVTAIAAAAAVAFPGLTSAVLLRGTGRVLKQALWSNAQEQMQTPLSHGRRAQARAATRGVLAPAGYAIAALGLAAIPPHVDERWLAAIVLVLAVVMVVVIQTSARKTYLAALERAVDERRLFLGAGRAPRLAPLERDALDLLEREIAGADADRAAVAAELLGLSRDEIQVDRIALGLAHADARVREASAHALARVPSIGAARHLARALSRERDPEVRLAIAQALRPAVAHHADVRADRAVQDALARAEEGEGRVASSARALRLRCAHEGEALGRALLPALRDGDDEARTTALDELTVEAAHAHGMQAALRALLEGGSPALRIAAAERVVALGLMTLLPDVVVLLKDPATGPAVARVLVEVGEVAFGDRARPAGASTLASLTEMARRIARDPARPPGDALVRRLLSHGDRAIRHHATFALADAIRAGRRAPLPAEVALPLIDREVKRGFLLASILAGIARDDGVPDWDFEPHVRFLAREVELRVEESRAELLELLLLRGASPRLVSAIEASRRAPSRERDAQVAELLEMALDPEIARKVVPIFERLSLRERIDAARRLGLVDDDAIEDPLDAIVALDDPHLRRSALLTYGARFEARFPDLAAIDTAMIPRIERMRFLRSVPLFEGISGEDLLSVAEVVEQIEHAAGAAIFHEGDPGEDLYLVVRGRVAIERGGVRLAELGEREFFGDLAVLDHQPRSADAICVEDAQLLRLRGADLRELMVTRPPIVKGILEVLVRRLRADGSRRASHA